MSQVVAILGASAKSERYSNKAFHMLQEHGHRVLPVSPGISNLEGVAVYPHLRDIKTPVDTLTMYVGPKISNEMTDEILQLHPTRVIFNPGSENKILAEALEKNGIRVVEACTLVLLRTAQFEKA